jgi:hypothetical protein
LPPKPSKPVTPSEPNFIDLNCYKILLSGNGLLGLLGFLALGSLLSLGGSAGSGGSGCGASLSRLHQVLKSTAVDSLGRSVGLCLCRKGLVGCERGSTGCGGVNDHDHTGLAMLSLGAVDGNGLGAGDGNSEAGKSTLADEDGVLAADSKSLAFAFALLASGGAGSGSASSSSASSSSAWSGNKSGVELTAWLAASVGLAGSDGVVLYLLANGMKGRLGA